MAIILKALGRLFGWMFKSGKMLPRGIAGGFIVLQFIFDWVRANLPYAFQNLAKTVFSAELVINEKVHMAIANVQGYNIFDLIHIIIAIYILIALVKFIGKILIKVAGAQAEWGAYFVAIIFVGIIEISTVKIIDGTFGFIPIYNGVIFLMMNIGPVMTNIFNAGTTVVAQNITQNATNIINATNSTIL